MISLSPVDEKVQLKRGFFGGHPYFDDGMQFKVHSVKILSVDPKERSDQDIQHSMDRLN